MNALFVPLLQSENLVGALLSVIDLLPGLHLFLLEQGDTVCEQLRVSLDAKWRVSSPRLTLCGAFLPLAESGPGTTGRPAGSAFRVLGWQRAYRSRTLRQSDRNLRPSV